jgi:hypothetical protein
MSEQPFRRRQIAWPVRCAIGIATDAVVAPIVWATDKFNRGDAFFRVMRKPEARRLAKCQPFGAYELSGRDVIVMAYVKSGTNWTLQIVQQLLHHGEAEFEHIHDVVPWPDSKSHFPMRHYAIPLEDETPWRSSPEGKRAIKTHLNWAQVPYSRTARYISVIRDPKDVFVSSYFFLQNMIPVPSVEAWVRLFQSDDFNTWGSWALNTAGYWALRDRPNVLVLSFKEMKRDLPGAVRRIADFLNVQVNDEILRRVCERSTFEYMKSIDRKFEVWNVIPWHRKTGMMRKGLQGGSSELLTRAQQREMDEYFMAELKRLGSDFPYEEFCDVTPDCTIAGKSGSRP